MGKVCRTSSSSTIRPDSTAQRQTNGRQECVQNQSDFCSSGTSLYKTESIGVLQYQGTRWPGRSHVLEQDWVSAWELLTDMETEWYQSLMSRQEAKVEICLSLHHCFQQRGKWRHTRGGVTRRKVFRRWGKTSVLPSLITFILRVTY